MLQKKSQITSQNYKIWVRLKKIANKDPKIVYTKLHTWSQNNSLYKREKDNLDKEITNFHEKDELLLHSYSFLEHIFYLYEQPENY